MFFIGTVAKDPRVNDVTAKDSCKIDWYQTTREHIQVRNVCTIRGKYWNYLTHFRGIYISLSILYSLLVRVELSMTVHVYWYTNVLYFSNPFYEGLRSTSCEIALGWVPRNPIDDKSTLIQLMTWSRQATSHYQKRCWPGSISPYGVTRPQWDFNKFQETLWNHQVILHHETYRSIAVMHTMVTKITKAHQTISM